MGRWRGRPLWESQGRGGATHCFCAWSMRLLRLVICGMTRDSLGPGWQGQAWRTCKRPGLAQGWAAPAPHWLLAARSSGELASPTKAGLSWPRLPHTAAWEPALTFRPAAGRGGGTERNGQLEARPAEPSF